MCRSSQQRRFAGRALYLLCDPQGASLFKSPFNREGHEQSTPLRSDFQAFQALERLLRWSNASEPITIHNPAEHSKSSLMQHAREPGGHLLLSSRQDTLPRRMQGSRDGKGATAFQLLVDLMTTHYAECSDRPDGVLLFETSCATPKRAPRPLRLCGRSFLIVKPYRN